MRTQAEIADFVASVKPNPNKSCSGCTACCHSVPVRELDLRAWERCPHVRTFPFARPGCAIYPNRPHSCRVWHCGWRSSDWGEDDDLRPDRCGVIVDPLPDVAWVNGKETPVIRLWVLPGHDDDFARDPVRALILALIHAGHTLMWDLSPDATGKRRSRVILQDKKTGQCQISSPRVATLAAKGQSERSWRAYDLMGGPS